MPLKIQNQETIVFIGDSITDCGRRGTDRPLGCGYVKMFADLLIIREPEKNEVTEKICHGFKYSKCLSDHFQFTE